MSPATIIAAVLLLVAVGGHAWFEARMMTHMFVQIPLLLTAGVLLADGIGRRTDGGERAASPWSLATGIAAFVFVSGVITTWMIPRALDAAVELTVVNVGKVVSLVTAGAVGRRAWHDAPALLRTFIFGNTAWMTATAGMLFLDTPARLCTSYGQSEQRQAGIALIAVTTLAVLVALRSVRRDAPASE